MCVSQTMKNNRWESSSRSLFVKTVWYGDHRHVILEKGDPAGERMDFQKSSRCRKTPSDRRSASSAPANVHSDNLHVSKLDFAASSRRVKKNNLVRPFQTYTSDDKTVTISVIPKAHVKFKSLTEELILKNKKLPIERKTPTTNTSSSIISPYFTYSKTGIKNDSTLSERVLNWMNITNNEVVDSCKDTLSKPIGKKRAITAHTCSIFQGKSDVSLEDKRFKVNSVPKCDEQIETTDCLTSVEEIFEDQKISPRMEGVHQKQEVAKSEGVRIRQEFTKRQLHIFLPNIPKKSSSEFGSSLSGTSSFLKYGK